MRMSIYIPDELKGRMDEANELNWSAIAQAAFREAIATHNVTRTENMNEAIERLRASKKRVEDQEYADGKTAGRRWAMNKAEYDVLERVAGLEASTVPINPTDPLITSLEWLIDPDKEKDDQQWRYFWEEVSGTIKRLGDCWAAGFADGAAEVFNEVKGKL
jgi:hypothetical protein